MMHVTNHAIQRYQERVEPVPPATVRDRLSGPVFDLAEKQGACGVILPTGQKAIIRDKVIITVLPKGAVHG